MSEESRRFLGTYFDHEAVSQLSRILNILAWVVAAIYASDFILGLGVFSLQYFRGFLMGLGFSDILQNIIYIFERPMRGIIYFGVLQALSKGLLIALDVEHNTRRVGRR